MRTVRCRFSSAHHHRIPFWTHCCSGLPTHPSNSILAGMGDKKPEISYYQIGGFRPNVALQGCSTSFFFFKYMPPQTCREFRGLQYDMRKLSEAIVNLDSTVDLVLGTLLVLISGAISNCKLRYPILRGHINTHSHLRVDQK